MSGDGQLTPLNIYPGINKDVTEYAAEGYWVSCNHVRFRDGHAEKQGGWVIEQTVQANNVSSTQFLGVARDVNSWHGIDTTKYLALGTHSKLELLTGGKYYDITPVESSVTANNIFSTSIGSNVVIVSLNAHTRAANDYVVFSTIAATIGGNILIGGEYQVVSVIGVNSFQIHSNVSAAATSISTGATVTADYLLGTGRADNGAISGWGTGPWSGGGWGVGSGSGTAELTNWSLDNFGQNLTACRKGGKLYQWVASSGTGVRAAVVTAAPTVNNIVLIDKVTRQAISYGCSDTTGAFDPMNIRWSDNENLGTWVAAVSNAAGEQPLQGGNNIVAAVQTLREILVLTDNTVFSQRRTGTEQVYTFEQVGSEAGAVSQHCAVDNNGTVYWMGQGSFYKYDGAITAIDSTIDKYLFQSDSVGSLNLEQKEKVFAGKNALFNELIWLYPSRDSTEIDSYAVHNYQDNTWFYGTINRTVWEDIGIFSKPYAADAQGNLFVQESGQNDNASPLLATLESCWFDIADGTDMLFLDRFIPDIRRLNGKNIELTLKFKKYPDASEEFTKGPYVITENTGKVSLRVRARQVKIILSQSVTDGDFELGKLRVSLQPDGRR